MALRSERAFYHELEGIRGYAFLVVFFTHYTYPLMPQGHRWTAPFRVLVDLAWVAVPIFFVLSGFLITGVLLKTRNREGYFRIFYARRSVRVFPLYYLIMLTLGGVGLALHAEMRGFWTNLLYVQNIWPSSVDLLRGIWLGGVHVEISHFWSLALEEQFYLLWPLVIWMCPTRRGLVWACFGCIGAATLFRFMTPLLGFTPAQAYFSSFTRGDALVLGALLAICRDLKVYERLQRAALPTALLGLLVLLGVRILTGASNPFLGGDSMWRVAWMIPVVNVTAAAIVLETMRSRGRLQRVCQWRPICRLGAISYACYAFHLLYCSYFQDLLFPHLEEYMPHRLAIVAMLFLALVLTVSLAALSYVLLEAPAMRLKRRLNYGPERTIGGRPAPGRRGAPRRPFLANPLSH